FVAKVVGLEGRFAGELVVKMRDCRKVGYSHGENSGLNEHTLNRYKSRLVANGSSQQLGVDFDETFIPVVKPTTIRTLLSFAVSRQWPIHQLDVKNAFLNVRSKHLVLGFSGLRGTPFGLDSLIVNVIHRCLCIHKYLRVVLSQKKYALYLLEHATMVHCNASRTPVDTDSKQGQDGVLVQDPTLYRNLAGGLQEPHFAALKRILRYVKVTLDFGLHLYASDTTSLVGYTDADWAGRLSTRSAEAEYRGVTNIVAETSWLHNLLRELHSPLLKATLVYCDNYAYIFTKGLPSALFEDFRSSLSVRLPPAPTARAY
nr:hypothetical protein [Tanacetum cinerariifolium]